MNDMPLYEIGKLVKFFDENVSTLECQVNFGGRLRSKREVVDHYYRRILDGFAETWSLDEEAISDLYAKAKRLICEYEHQERLESSEVSNSRHTSKQRSYTERESMKIGGGISEMCMSVEVSLDAHERALLLFHKFKESEVFKDDWKDLKRSLDEMKVKASEGRLQDIDHISFLQGITTLYNSWAKHVGLPDNCF